MVPQNIFLLAIAGALGTLARYGTSELVTYLVGKKFAWSTLTVNLIGSLLFGLVWTLVVKRQILSEQQGLVILTGFMGAYTTFSTFAFESSQFFEAGRWPAGLLNLALQNGLGLLAVWAGAAIARAV